MFRTIWTLAKKPAAFTLGVSSLLTLGSAMIYGGDFVPAGCVLTLAALWGAGCWLDSDFLSKKKPIRPRPRVRNYEEQLKRFQRRRIEYHSWQIGGAACVIVLLFGLVVLVHGKREQKELDNLNGRLFPANEPAPQIQCLKEQPPENAIKVFFGPAVAVLSKFPQTVISADGIPRLGIAKNSDGSIGINAHVVSTDGRIIAEVKNSQFIVNPNNYLRMERKDRSSLSLLDQFGKTVLDVRYLNPSAVLISAFVVYTRAGDMVELAPPTTAAQLCFGDRDDPNKGDLDMFRPNPQFGQSPVFLNPPNPILGSYPPSNGENQSSTPHSVTPLKAPPRQRPKKNDVPPVAHLKVNQRQITSTRQDAPYAYRVVLTTDEPLTGFRSLVIYCDAQLTEVLWETFLFHNKVSAPIDGSNFRFSFELVHEAAQEVFDPEHPLTFSVWSKNPVVCRRVEAQ